MKTLGGLGSSGTLSAAQDLTARVLHKSEFTKKYELGDVVGTGNFSVVRRARRRDTGEMVAVKVMTVNRKADNAAVGKEVEVLGKLDHPNIIRVLEVFTARRLIKGKKVYIVTELVDGGRLHELTLKHKAFAEPVARALLRPVLSSLAYLHAHGMAHRDLKPENILFTLDGRVKVVDFGFATFAHATSGMHTVCGTPQFLAPEIIRPTGPAKGYDESVDVWAFGVLAYLLLAGELPFPEKRELLMFHTILKGEYSLSGPVWDAVSDEAKDLVAKCLCVKPQARTKAEDALAHPWFQLHDDNAELCRLVKDCIPARKAAAAAAAAAEQQLGNMDSDHS